MANRPSISDEVHERVEIFNVGKNPPDKVVYEEAIKLLIDSDGEAREWYKRCVKLAEEEGIQEKEAVSRVVNSVVSEEGKPKPTAKQLLARGDYD